MKEFYTLVIGKKPHSQMSKFNLLKKVEPPYVEFTKQEKIDEHKQVIEDYKTVLENPPPFSSKSYIENLKKELDFFENITDEDYWKNSIEGYELNEDGLPMSDYNKIGRWDKHEVVFETEKEQLNFIDGSHPLIYQEFSKPWKDMITSIVKDGEWYEKDEIENWNEKFEELLNVPRYTTITIYKCHF
jgi:hypothetical protein